MNYSIKILIGSLIGWTIGTIIAHGIFHIYISYYEKYKSYPDVRTTVSFDIYHRPDGTGYIKYGDSDVTACEVLLSNDK